MLPQPPELDGTVNYAMIDAVAYQDDPPWPPAPTGVALHWPYRFQRLWQ